MSEVPQYRKLINDKSYYRIEDENHFMEIQLIGKKAFELKIQAIQYPEKLKIKEIQQTEARTHNLLFAIAGRTPLGRAW